MTLKEFIIKAESSPIQTGEYIQESLQKAFWYKDELINEIHVARNKKNDRLLEALLIVAAYDGVDSDFTQIFCRLLTENWHHSHEDIVMLLEEIKDPASVEILYETAIKIPSHDDGRSLAKKCIWALGTINTKSSREKLLLLKKLNDPVITWAVNLEIERTNQQKS